MEAMILTNILITVNKQNIFSGIIFDEDNEEEVEGRVKWTDRQLLKFGKLTVIELEIQECGNFIQRIRARFPYSPNLISYH